MRLSLLLILLYGCATDVVSFTTGDGRRAYNLDCSNTLSSSMSDCYRTAQRLCPKGFDILNSESSDGVLTLSRNATVACK
jgi:hypothetical protein